MFEGLVRQLLLGYLGRYVKDIQKEQLKITLWNEEVLLENVELILEAFDYLQLPFALKQGRVGRLSIRIPWKKLGWDPLIITLEDVFVSACQRDDQEWSMDAVERREFAGKKAKLAAAELAKLSRRVSVNHAGQSFTSYITAKVLDSIQVSIRNFHVLYSNMKLDSAQIVFGLKFSSLTTMKQNLVGSSGGRARGGQVNKIVEIKGLEIYSSTFQSDVNLMSLDHNRGSNFWSMATVEGHKFDHMLKPLDLSISLMLNRSGQLDSDLPQYSVNAELTKLVLSLDEVQLQQIFILLDYLCTSQLREKYGRYRPRHCPASEKPDGWQKLWWQYAQQSVLSDVREKLKKTSWKYLGQRLSNRRKYINLYKAKLDCLQQEQSVDESVVRELEQMERESDIDDILSYRSAAECELQEVLLNTSNSNVGMKGGAEITRTDERSSRSGGWLNWLSRGMLGAGGTDDSSQFSGVVSDEVVKDIYEATKFDPLVVSSSTNADSNEKIHTSAIKLSIALISVTLRSRNSVKKIAKLILEGAVFYCNIWEELANVDAVIKSVTMVNPCNKNIILVTGESFKEESALQNDRSSFRMQVDVSPKQDVGMSVKVMLQPIEATCDAEFLLDLMDFFTVLKSFKSLQERVILSLNGIEDVKARLSSKVGYLLSKHKKVIWDVSLSTVTVKVPWRNMNVEDCNLVLMLGSIFIKSKSNQDSLASNIDKQSCILKDLFNSTFSCDSTLSIQLQDLYNHYEVQLVDCEIKLALPRHHQMVCILEKFGTSVTVASCVISDESILNQLEVSIVVSTFHAHFSPTIFESAMELISHLDILQSTTETVLVNQLSSVGAISNRVDASEFGISVSWNLQSVSLNVDLANDGENSSILMFDIQGLDICYSRKELQDCCIFMKAFKVITYPLKATKESYVLASCGDYFASTSGHQQDMDVAVSNQSDNYIDRSSSTEACFLLHLEVKRMENYACNMFSVCLKDADLHCYPHVCCLVIGFFEKISSYGASGAGKIPSSDVNDTNKKGVPCFGFERFGFSNFIGTGSSEGAGISLDSYPFLTICNRGHLGCLESSLLYSILDWRKVLHLRDKKFGSLKCSVKKGSEVAHGSSWKSQYNLIEFPASGNFRDANQFFIDTTLCGIRVHFHDSMCTIGTVTLPFANSSLLTYDDCVDLLFSVEGLVLTSSLWTKTCHEFLWGPCLPNLSPILNLRVRKGDVGSLSSQLEVTIGIQHVCCVLPTEYLTVIMGYFSLPDWSPDSEQNEQSYTESGSSIIYKFEVVDSILIVPVEKYGDQFLKAEIQQLYCSYIDQCVSNSVMMDIPPEYLVPVNKVAEYNNCLNIFGRDLVLSFVLPKDDEYGCLTCELDSEKRSSFILLAPLSADVWVRIPWERESASKSSSTSTCIMSRIQTCHIIMDDWYAYDGFEALLDVINQFSSVYDESKLFTCDVLNFRQLRRCIRENGVVSAIAPETIFTDIKFCVDSMMIKLNHFRRDSGLFIPVAKWNMQFICSASFIDEKPLSLDLNFSSLALSSMLNSVMLARCTCNSTLSVLGISFSKSEHGDNETCIALPSLDIWLHFSEWTEIIELCNSFHQKIEKASPLNVSSKQSGIAGAHSSGSGAITAQVPSPNSSMSTDDVVENMKRDTEFLIMRSDNIGISVHFPLCVSEAAVRKNGVAEFQEENPQKNSSRIDVGKHSKYFSIEILSKHSELFLADKSVRLKVFLEKISGKVGTCEEANINSLPLFQIYQVDLETESFGHQTGLVHTNVSVTCDRLEAWLSHQILYFGHGVVFDIPAAGSSQLSLPSINFKLQLRKISLLISDGRWSCSGHLLEFLLRNFLLHTSMTESKMDFSVASELQVKYNNIRKVSWEPFVEPWKFQITMIRKYEMTALLNSSVVTDICLTSTAPLNLNITESLVECISRSIEMIKDAWGMIGPDVHPRNQLFLKPLITDNVSGGRFAPYVLQNLTSLPLMYNVYQGLRGSDEFDASDMRNGKLVQPGDSVPIYLNETADEQLYHYRPTYSSDRLSEKQLNSVAHHFMTVQLDGTGVPSVPISMDLVGLSYFEVDFSKASKMTEFERTGDTSKYKMNNEETANSNPSSSFVVPVVFDVSVQQYSKLIRLYSTVILSNATSTPLELRFDIPFGISPKILDPIHPGQEFPLPLHLAEGGRMRWRPVGKSCLWSEAHNISNILSQESKIGHSRSFVCYPSHPSSDPFRCCLSVQNILLTSSSISSKGSPLHVDNSLRQSAQSPGRFLHGSNNSKKRFIRQVTLSTPFVVNNYLPESVCLTIETGGIPRTTLLSEAQKSFHDIDPSHDLGLELNIHGFRTSFLKFPRAETFSTIAKFSGTKFSLSETLAFDPEISNDTIHVIVEKTMDVFSGARELFIFVPFLLYNCTGFPLIVSHTTGGKRGLGCTIPCCYDMFEQELLQGERDGLSFLSLDQDIHATDPQREYKRSSLVKYHIVSTRKIVNPHLGKFVSKHLISSGSSELSHEQPDGHDFEGQKVFLSGAKKHLYSPSQSDLREIDFANTGNEKVQACMYSPLPVSAATEIEVHVSRCLPRCTQTMPNSSWSAPFPLVPPSSSTSVVVPQSSSSAAFIISVTSSALAGPFAGRTRAVTFQPRYVISNACGKDLCYKQKGTDCVSHLGAGQHSHLHLTDTTRELLVSVRFNEPGWQWSGSFLPDHLGDTQLKMRNYVSGQLNMIRVEVQNADVFVRDEEIVGSLSGNSGTNLILISDDDTGYMPYRIDNFSKERLRVYQQRCETFDTTIHPYTSCAYAWDEPCYPHRLTIEVPGERVVGSFALDDLKENVPVLLQATAEKPERTLLLSISAEGATKLLSIVDSSYHILKDETNLRGPKQRKQEQKQEKLVNYKEKISFNIPFVGVSLINSYPQELVFACAKNITAELLDSMDQQNISFLISYLQIDNQMQTTPYPVILSFNFEQGNTSTGHRNKDDCGKSRSEVSHITSENACEPVFYLSLTKWRKKDVALVSFEHISLRVADFCLELEQEVILSMLEFFKSVSPRFQSTVLPFPDSTLRPVLNDLGSVKEPARCDSNFAKVQAGGDLLSRTNEPSLNRSQRSFGLLPSIVPIGAPWQKIYLLARRQKKIYVELLDLSPIKFTLSFSSSPWMVRNGIPTSGESLIHRGFMALADIEGARIHLKELTIAHQMASLESIQEILTRHYTRQFLHEMYKVFGSAGVIGNPMGFARSLGLGIRDFLSVPAKSLLQSPTGLISGMALGTTSLVSNTVYALSDAATQFSKAAHKGIVAFTFDDQAVARMDKQQKGVVSYSKGVINEVLEGLTGLLQSPIQEAEKHGLPGLLSGIAFGVAGLVARPAASILEVTGKTAQSIRNRSKLHNIKSQRYRVRLPRPLSRELPLMPYSWEEAIGTTLLLEVGDGLKYKDEVLVMCKALKQAGKFAVVTERLILIVSCSSLEDLGTPDFQGVAADLNWVVESEISLDSIIHADTDESTVHIVGSSSDGLSRQNQHQTKRGSGTSTKWWNNPSTPLPLFQTNLELASREDAMEVLQVSLATIEHGKGRGWGSGYLLHQRSIR